jgi:hypothetical protein
MKIRFGFEALALALLAAACGGAQTPTSPTITGSALPGMLSSTADVSSALEMRAVTGRFTDALTGAAATNITLTVDGIGAFAGDTAGHFNLEAEAPDGRYRVTASGDGVVSRQTTLTFPGQGPVISLIPTSFNTQALDEMTRQFGEAGVMKRWIQVPALIIETSLLDLDASFDAAGAPTDTAVASAEQMSAADIATLVAQLSRALPLMTGGALSAFSSVTQQTTPAGASVNVLADGAITVVRFAASGSQCRGYGGFAYLEDYTAVSGYAFLQTCSTEGLAAHELGHALGFGHVAATASVMAAAVTGDVTEFDRQAGAIAFNRPPGNRAPDVDPESFAVNQPLRRMGFRRTVVRAVP